MRSALLAICLLIATVTSVSSQQAAPTPTLLPDGLTIVTGVQNKQTAQISITFETTFSGRPTVVISPFFDGGGGAVGHRETITHVDNAKFQVTGGNAAPNFYVAWMAIGTAAPTTTAPIVVAGKLNKRAAALDVPFGTTFSDVPTVVVTPFWNRGAVAHRDTITHVDSSKFTVVSGNAASDYCVAWMAVGNASPPAGPSLHTRPSIALLDPGGPQIAALRRGVQVMMNRCPDDPTSWLYQANIHATQDGAARPGWDQCQHGSFFFFSWHRMYLYYFERILRAASGDPNLALPYWNYSDPAQRALPLAFRQPNNSTSNPLFVAERADGINEGTALLDDSAVSFDLAFNDTEFSSPPGSALSFGGQTVTAPQHFLQPHGQLEQRPHDIVHVLVGGPNGWMFDPQLAARDPIFYLHHANVDRLWKRWLDQGGGRQDPVADSEWMNTSFVFFDENGRQVQMSGSEIIDTVSQLNYRYDDDPVIVAQMVHVPAAQVSTARPKVVRQMLAAGPVASGPTELGTEPTTVSVPLPEPARTRLDAILSSTDRQKVVLALEDIRYATKPGIYYEIYVNLPPGEEPNFRSSRFVGTLSFFGRAPHTGTNHGAPGPATVGFMQDYDITNALRAAKAQGSGNPTEVSLTFVMHGLVGADRKQLPVAPGTKATIGNVSVSIEQ